MHISQFSHTTLASTSQPELLEDLDHLLNDIDKWLVYFLQACPRARGSYTYTLVLLVFHEPFPKVIKATVSWFKNKIRIVEIIAPVRKPIVLGWLLFSTSNMDEEILHGEISLHISSIPAGLCWKMISVGAQGPIPKNNR